jgi:hypothetical protein
MPVNVNTMYLLLHRYTVKQDSLQETLQGPRLPIGKNLFFIVIEELYQESSVPKNP